MAVSLAASFIGLDRDRAFYPTLTAVIASYYGLFAVMGGSTQALAMESMVIAAFLSVAILGFRTNLWFVVGALASHGIFDVISSAAQNLPRAVIPGGADDAATGMHRRTAQP